MSFKMLSKLILRREFNRSNCVSVLPFCYKIDSSLKPYVLNECLTRRQNQTNCEQSVENKSKRNNNLEENPFYGKYSDKIKKALNQTKNVLNESSADDPKTGQTVDHKFKDIKSLESTEDSIKTNEFKRKVQKMKSKNSLNQSLDDILKLDLLRDKSPQEITEIWNSYHKTKDCIFAAIPSDTYDKMFWMSSKYKTFIFPIPRTNGQQTDGNNYEFILSQFNGHKCFFTPLIAYQTHKELAPVCLTIHHFPELQKDKQIVLMLGEYDSNLLNGFEAQCLANQLQWYYSAEQNMRQSILLHRFNVEPSLFNHMEVIEELENNILAVGMASGPQID